ncbi:UNKNOWN [Stylonychia lemnae]|uniref:Uncharacterized protein n=1 Tax=Stylonychia lemnae TaxID=5949 RepID=A0A077ZQ33_STYLE|nr:UNKNOWN [Stylonychia lemnae]|eukprot:CDW71490.1 UNKNOWN [Stylonychia lemnae]
MKNLNKWKILQKMVRQIQKQKERDHHLHLLLTKLTHQRLIQQTEENNRNYEEIIEVYNKSVIEEANETILSENTQSKHSQSIKGSSDYYKKKLQNQKSIYREIRKKCIVMAIINLVGFTICSSLCAFMYPLDILAFAVSIIFMIIMIGLILKYHK